MNAMDHGVPSSNDPQTRRCLPRKLATLLVLTLVYAFIRLSRSPIVMPAAVALLAVLEVVRLLRRWRASKLLDAGCEALYFVVLMSLLFGAFRHSLADHLVLLSATALYIPGYTLHCNLRVALALGLAIAAAVLPITLGIVTDLALADLLSDLYMALVLALWVFCSKLGAKIFGFQVDGEKY